LHWLVSLVRFLFLPRLAIKPYVHELTNGLGKLSEIRCYDRLSQRIYRFKWQKLPYGFEWHGDDKGDSRIMNPDETPYKGNHKRVQIKSTDPKTGEDFIAYEFDLMDE